LKTAQLANYIAKDIEEGDVGGCADDFDELSDIFKHEYCARDHDKETLFDFMFESLIGAIARHGSSFRGKIAEIVPIFSSMMNAREVSTDLFKIFSNSLAIGRRHMYYTMCLLYLVDVEGQFDEAVRIVSFLRLAAIRKDVQISHVWESKLWDLRKQLAKISSKESEVLFSGWENGHLRNSIAHCRFKYDKSSRRMVFWDLDQRTRKENYRKALPYFDFYSLFVKTGDTVMILIFLFMILMIHDCAFSFKSSV
jgi:hypothetical protein